MAIFYCLFEMALKIEKNEKEITSYFVQRLLRSKRSKTLINCERCANIVALIILQIFLFTKQQKFISISFTAICGLLLIFNDYLKNIGAKIVFF